MTLEKGTTISPKGIKKLNHIEALEKKKYATG
jgi:hypothetical protein